MVESEHRGHPHIACRAVRPHLSDRARADGGGLGWWIGFLSFQRGWARACGRRLRRQSLARSGPEITSESARGRWGVGLITWRATSEVLEQVLSYHPDVVFLSFGDARPFVPSIADSGCRLVCQVQEVEDAREAKALGADVIVAQGAEAGGHGSVRATLPLVPAIVDAVHPTPVLAAGGIGDGRGLAAVLALGAAGAVIGTRFCAAEESLMHPLAKQRLISSTGGETVRTHVFDEVRGIEWSKGYTGRALRNAFVDRWHDHDEGLGNDLAERERYLAAAEQGDFDTALILAGEVVDMVERVELASEIFERIGM